MKSIQPIIKRIDAYLIDFGKRFLEWAFDFASWFLEDVAYTLLPIAVIAAIKLITYSKENYLFLSPEWSFAAIVSFGAAITGLIKLKTEIQHDFSDKIYTGTRLYVLFLIASVIVLSLVVLRDDGLAINSTVLWVLQLILLFFSLFSLYVAHIEKKRYLKLEFEIPTNLGRGQYYQLLNRKINQVQDKIFYLKLALKKHSEIDFPAKMNYQDVQFWEESERNTLLQKLDNLEQSVSEIHNTVIELANSPIPKNLFDKDVTEEPSKKSNPRKNAYRLTAVSRNERKRP
jgi:hypothetical protein